MKEGFFLPVADAWEGNGGTTAPRRTCRAFYFFFAGPSFDSRYVIPQGPFP